MKKKSCSSKDRASVDSKIFIFRHNLVREGDILLCTDPDSRLSDIIRRATGGKFSHAAICTVRPLFIEAVGLGVFEFSLGRAALHNPSSVRILRLRKSILDFETISATAAALAVRYESRDYSSIAAIMSVVPGWNVHLKSKAFCSYVVAEAYKQAGCNVGPEGKLSQHVTPADIAKSDKFEDLTDRLLVETIFNSESADGLYFLDAPRPRLPSDSYNSEIKKITKSISGFLRRQGLPGVYSYEEALGAVMNCHDKTWYPEFDQFVDDLIRRRLLPKIPYIRRLVREARDKTETVAKSLSTLNYKETVFALQQISAIITTKHELIRHRKSGQDMYCKFIKYYRDSFALSELSSINDLFISELEVDIESMIRVWTLYANHAASLGVPASVIEQIGTIRVGGRPSDL